VVVLLVDLIGGCWIFLRVALTVPPPTQPYGGDVVLLRWVNVATESTRRQYSESDSRNEASTP
jgi:hypothetical protein